MPEPMIDGNKPIVVADPNKDNLKPGPAGDPKDPNAPVVAEKVPTDSGKGDAKDVKLPEDKGKPASAVAKFKSPEELAKGYENVEKLNTKLAQENVALKAQVEAKQKVESEVAAEEAGKVLTSTFSMDKGVVDIKIDKEDIDQLIKDQAEAGDNPEAYAKAIANFNERTGKKLGTHLSDSVMSTVHKMAAHQELSKFVNNKGNAVVTVQMSKIVNKNPTYWKVNFANDPSYATQTLMSLALGELNQVISAAIKADATAAPEITEVTPEVAPAGKGVIPADVKPLKVEPATGFINGLVSGVGHVAP